MKAGVFIDFSNLSIAVDDLQVRGSADRMNWKQASKFFDPIHLSREVCSEKGHVLSLEDCRIFGSYISQKDKRLSAMRISDRNTWVYANKILPKIPGLRRDFVPRGPSGGGSFKEKMVDSYMVVSAMMFLYESEVDFLWIASGDADFIPLIPAFNRLGKGIGFVHVERVPQRSESIYKKFGTPVCMVKPEWLQKV